MKEKELVNKNAVVTAMKAGQLEMVTWGGIFRHRELKQVTRASGAEYIMVYADTEEVSALDHFVRASEQIEFVVRLMRQKASGETISALNWDWNGLQKFYQKAEAAAWFSAQILNHLCLENGAGYLLADLTKYQTCPGDEQEWQTLTATAVDQLSDEFDRITARLGQIEDRIKEAEYEFDQEAEQEAM